MGSPTFFEDSSPTDVLRCIYGIETVPRQDSELSKKKKDYVSTHDWCSASVRMLNDVTTILTTELNRKIGTEIYCLYHLFIFAMKYTKKKKKKRNRK